MKRWKLALLLVVMLSVSLVSVKSASAAYCDKGSSGAVNIAGCKGFFNGKSADCADYTKCHYGTGNSAVINVLDDGLKVGSATAMVAAVKSNLNNGNTHNQRGAAFIVDYMLGYNPGSYSGGISYASAHFDEWADMIHYYADAPNSANYGVDFNRNISAPNNNSAYFNYIDDDAFHTNDDGGPPSIHFYWPGGVFDIERSCANLLGDVEKPPAPPANWDLAPASTVSATTILIGQPVNFSHAIHNKGPAKATYAWEVQKSTTNAAGSYAWQSGLPKGSASNLAVGDYNPAYGNATDTYTFSASQNDGDRICERIYGNHDTGATSGGDASTAVCTTLSVPWRLNSTTSVCADINYTTVYATHPAAYCNIVYANTGAASDSATFKHTVKHYQGATAASFSYQVKTYYSAAGDSPNASSVWGNLGAAVNVSSLANGSSNPNQLQSKYSFDKNAPLGAKYCERIYYTNIYGPNTDHDYSTLQCITLLQRPAVSCALTATPPDIQLGESTTVKLLVELTGVWWTGSGKATIGGTPNITMSQSVGPGAGKSYLTATKLYAGNPTLGNFKITGSYTGTMSDHLPAGGCGDTTYHVVTRPYVKAYGGDIQAGFGPSTGGTTCSGTTPRIDSWNNGSTSGYSGAGAQFGVQALSFIEGFVSAQGNTGTTPPQGSGLSFANNANVASDTYGGFFANGESCTNYAADLTESTVAGGDITLSGGNATVQTQGVANGDHKTIYVKGKNVIIENNIVYTGAGNYVDLTSIPSFKLVVVGGNIYIKSSVTELAGMYIAQASGSTGGNIYTCADADVPVAPTSSAFYDTCKTPLTVYGSFIAKRVNLLRTSGEARDAVSSHDASSKNLFPLNGASATGTSNAAERFIYSPEEWLGQTGGGYTDGYDAIVSLPPTL